MLDSVLHRHIRLGDGLTERIKVHAHEVDCFNVIVLQLFHVLRYVAAGEERTVDFRMERLYAAVADFRKTGNVTYTCYRNT